MKPIPELGKPSLIQVSSLFEDISIVIADADNKMAILAKKILGTLGCRKIFIVHDGLEVLALMKEEPIDLVVTDWQMKAMGGLDLARHLRQSPESPNRMIPIIMLTGRTDRMEVAQARDSGITEYVVKPFSAKSLLSRVYDIVENPRSFILAKGFIGPDRRRKSSMSVPEAAGAESGTRVPLQRQKPLIIPQSELKQLIIDDTPRMILPDYTLKKKIGMEVPAELIKAPEMLEQSQAVITDAAEEFLGLMKKDVQALESSFRLLAASPDHTAHFLEEIMQAAASIQSRAGIFDYLRASQVAGLLREFCLWRFRADNRYHLLVLGKHIQILAAIFAGKLTGDAGELGRGMMNELGALIKKYRD